MRATSTLLRVGGAALVALALRPHDVHAVANCGECPGDKTCILQNTADAVPGGQDWLNVKFCNFKKEQKSEYELEFALELPLACDESNTLVMPKLKELAPEEPCNSDGCMVRVNLASQIDWAIALKNGNNVNHLTLKITSANGKDEVVKIATASAAAAAEITGGAAPTNEKAYVCVAEFGVAGKRLSSVKECNKARVCVGKATDAACSASVQDKLLVSNVSCTGEVCTGKVELKLPCDAVSGDSNALIMGVQVGNGGDSNYASIATLSDVEAATISTVDPLKVSDTSVIVKSDAVCPQSSLTMTLSGLDEPTVSSNNDGTIIAALASPLTSAQSGKTLTMSVSQCGVAGKEFKIKVGGDAVSAASNDDDDNTEVEGSTSGDAAGTVKPSKPAGAGTTQDENPSTGLPGGLYIGIGIGVIAFLGFLFECWYHKRRRGHGAAELPAAQGYGHTAA